MAKTAARRVIDAFVGGHARLISNAPGAVRTPRGAPPRARSRPEGRNALAARAIFFDRLGEIRDRRFEQQRYRRSGLALITAAIALCGPSRRQRCGISVVCAARAGA